MVLGSDETSWMHDGVAGMLKSDDFQRPIKQFIEHNCAVFAEDENQLEHTRVHAEFIDLLESVSPEQFVEVCQNVANTGLNNLVCSQILSLDDFLVFKKMMQKTNSDIQLAALQRMKDDQNAALEDAGLSSPVANIPEDEQAQIARAVAESNAAQAAGQQAAGSAEDEAAAAIKASEEEAAMKAAERAREDAELEMAIAMSLALEEETRRAQEEQAQAAQAAKESEAPAPAPAPAAPVAPAPAPVAAPPAPVAAPVAAAPVAAPAAAAPPPAPAAAKPPATIPGMQGKVRAKGQLPQLAPLEYKPLPKLRAPAPAVPAAPAPAPAPAAPESSGWTCPESNRQVSNNEMEERAKYLRAQRDKLRAKSGNSPSASPAAPARGVQAPVAANVSAGPAAPTTRLDMRAALAKRFKEDMMKRQVE